MMYCQILKTDIQRNLQHYNHLAARKSKHIVINVQIQFATFISNLFKQLVAMIIS